MLSKVQNGRHCFSDNFWSMCIPFNLAIFCIPWSVGQGLSFNRPMVSENYTQCKVPAHGAVTTFQKDQDSRNYSQNSPIHPIKKPSKRRLTIVKSQNRRLGDLGQMVPSGRILIFRARERHIEYDSSMHNKWSKNAIGQLANEIAGTAKEIARTSQNTIGRVL